MEIITYRSVVAIPNNMDRLLVYTNRTYTASIKKTQCHMTHSTIQSHTSYNATYVCQHDREQRRNKRAHVCLNAHDLPTFLLNCTARIHILKLQRSRQIHYI